MIKKHRVTAATNRIIPIIKRRGKLFTKRIELQTAIENFYLENSVIDPGKKAVIKINGQKHQKQYLTHSILDLCDMFNSDRAKKVSYRVFARYRPRQCLFPKVTARDTCACPQHENMKLLVNYLNSKNIISENSHYRLTKSLTCEKSSLDCLSRKCNMCQEKKITLDLDKKLEGRHTFKKWITSKEKRMSEKTGRDIVVTIAKKVELSMSTQELQKYFYEELDNFMSHLHKAVHQFQALKQIKSSLKDNEAVILVDFSQNYQCKYATEIQGVHFGASRTQITLHTGMLYTKSVKQGFATLSESLKHDSCAVTAHLKRAIIKLQSEGRLDGIDTLHFASDGPMTQYKNKNMFHLATQYLSKKFPQIKKVTYNYSESGHGKNAADGIGAALKRTADNLVKYGADIPDYETFVKYMIENNGKIVISNVTKEDIDEVSKELPKDIKSIPGTRKIYQFRWNCEFPTIVNFNYLSCFECDVGNICIHNAKNTFDYNPHGNIKSEMRKISNAYQKTEGTPRKKVKAKITSVEKLSSHKFISRPNGKAAKKVFTMIKTDNDTCSNKLKIDESTSLRKSARKPIKNMINSQIIFLIE